MVTTKAITKQSKNPKPPGKKASAFLHASSIQIQLFVVLFKLPMFIYVYYITSTLLSRQNKRNLCYGPILVTGVLRNFYCNF